MTDAGRGAEVSPERRLTVGSRRHEVEPPARAASCSRRSESRRHGPRIRGERWHREEDIVGEQGDQARRDRRTRTRGRTPPPSLARRVSRERGPLRDRRSVDSRRCRPARARLRRLLTESIVESSMSATSFAWNPRTSRKTSTASWRGGRTCSAVTNASEIDSACSYRASGPSGASITPSRRASGNGSSQTISLEPGRLGRFILGDVPLLGRASAGGTTRVETPVGGDPVEPRADRGPSLERLEALPGGQQRVLERVLGVLEGSEHPVAVHLELSTVRLGQLSERLAVPGSRPGDQIGRHLSTLASRPSRSSSWVSTPPAPRTGRPRPPSLRPDRCR